MYRIIEDLYSLPVAESTIKEIEEMEYQFGYAIVFEDYATLCTPSGFRYHIIPLDVVA